MVAGPRLTRAETGLLLAALVCYAVGYPLALWGSSSLGWVLVALGGPFLFAVGALLVRRLHRSS